MTSTMSTATIDGWVAEGFAPIREAFARAVPSLGSGGGAFAAYVHGKPVVDLWAGQARTGQPWAEDTLAVIMSATKGLVALSAQILVDRGLLDVDAPVASYWPEFAQSGKASITVRQVLTHTAGVLSFPGYETLLKWDGAGWDDYDAIAAGFAVAEPCWEPGTQCGYHAMSYGWLVGEIVRRITGQTVGAFFDDNVATPLGLDLHIGTSPSDQDRVAHVIDRMRASLPPPLRLVYPLLHRRLCNPRTLSGRAYLASDGLTIVDRAEVIFRNPRFMETEVPAGNGTATARSLARLYAMLAADGELDGTRIVSADSARTWGVEVIRAPDALMDDIPIPGLGRLLMPPVARTLGYLVNIKLPRELPHFGPNPAAYGAEGAGGQISFCDPAAGIAVGFVRSELAGSPTTAARLVKELYDVIGGRAV
jgi:CubicO group peptidase (beta-lactamase class C family)